MLLTKWKDEKHPVAGFDPFGALSAFDDHLPSTLWNEARSFLPPVDVSEKENEYVITMEAPGMEKDDIRIELEDNVLTLSGEKKESHEEKNERLYRLERRYGSFTRSFRIRGVEADKIAAGFKNGVLTVTIPKSEEVKPKKISIR
ncbi:hypothetical protein MNBD_NITROSPINAE02-1262 [hydrothermal vent metagenome]|uniref:SHSP domain-containing protein n=1 Tax=hydrothermal vent metagenome TaxID=652676 RepID=A0A3B1BVG1_9ZZZZ